MSLNTMNRNIALFLGLTLFLASCGKSPSDEAPPTSEPETPDTTDEPGPPMTETLPPPSGLRVDIGDERLTVFWPNVEGADTYRVYVGTPSSEEFPEGAQEIAAQASHAVVPELTNNQTYQIAVATVKDGKAGTPSEGTSATPMKGLNDTGLQWCIDKSSAQIACSLAEAGGQDGALGRDAAAATGGLTKAGAGEGGFDFSWLNEKGEPFDASAKERAQARCVVDNHTGLMWELKTEEGLHDTSNRYTWFSLNTKQENWQGVENGGSCTGSKCDTQAFVEAVNASALCGFADWRLPTPDELVSIGSIGKANPSIEAEFFLHASDAWYWTSGAFLPDTSLAWAVGQQFGHSYPQGKDGAYALRLVRGAETVDKTDDCVSEQWQLNEGLATDLETGLTWQRCSVGQQWNGSDCSAQGESLNWWEALEFDVSSLLPSSIGEAYAQGWRLPNAKELASLANRACPQVLNTEVFPSNPTGRYWTSSPFSDYTQASWVIDFSSGALHDSAQDNEHHVRLVRGQQSLTIN